MANDLKLGHLPISALVDELNIEAEKTRNEAHKLLENRNTVDQAVATWGASIVLQRLANSIQSAAEKEPETVRKEMLNSIDFMG